MTLDLLRPTFREYGSDIAAQYISGMSRRIWLIISTEGSP